MLPSLLGLLYAHISSFLEMPVLSAGGMRAERAKDPDERKRRLFDRKDAPARNVILQSFVTRTSRIFVSNPLCRQLAHWLFPFW
jgi:hypothetical protein